MVVNFSSLGIIKPLSRSTPSSQFTRDDLDLFNLFYEIAGLASAGKSGFRSPQHPQGLRTRKGICICLHVIYGLLAPGKSSAFPTTFRQCLAPLPKFCSWNWGSEQAGGHLRLRSQGQNQMWAFCPPAQGFSWPLRCFWPWWGWARRGSLGECSCGLRRHRPAGRQVVDPERLAHLPEEQVTDTLKAGEGLVIDGLQLRTDRAI